MSSAETAPVCFLSHYWKMRSTLDRDAYLRRRARLMSFTKAISTPTDWRLAGYAPAVEAEALSSFDFRLPGAPMLSTNERVPFWSASFL
jgi:hypothetical protein